MRKPTPITCVLESKRGLKTLALDFDFALKKHNITSKTFPISVLRFIPIISNRSRLQILRIHFYSLHEITPETVTEIPDITADRILFMILNKIQIARNLQLNYFSRYNFHFWYFYSKLCVFVKLYCLKLSIFNASASFVEKDILSYFDRRNSIEKMSKPTYLH